METKTEKRGRPKQSPTDIPQSQYDIIQNRDQKEINKLIQERVENWDHDKWKCKTKG
jgi:hypothetical protein